MKFVQISFHFEYAERIEKILAENEIAHFIRYPMVQGRDADGHQYGSKVFPGHITVIQASCADADLDGLLDDLEAFRTQKQSHSHLQALVLPVERRIGPEENASEGGEEENE